MFHVKRRRGKVRSIRDGLSAIPHSAPLPLLSESQPPCWVVIRWPPAAAFWEAYPSLPRKRESSLISLPLLSKPQPLTLGCGLVAACGGLFGSCKIRSIRDGLAAIPHAAPLPLLSKSNPLTRRGYAASVRRHSRQRLCSRWASVWWPPAATRGRTTFCILHSVPPPFGGRSGSLPPPFQ